MPSIPDLPKSAFDDVDSMLSTKFGREIANYFSTSPLNRVSFLRQKHNVMASALTHSSARFLLLNNLAPLGRDPSNLAFATYQDVKPLIGDMSLGKAEDELTKCYDSSLTLPLIVFLGLDEIQHDGFQYQLYKGTPYFALDVTPRGTIERQATQVIRTMKDKGLSFIEGRVANTLRASEGLTLTHPHRTALTRS